MLTPEFLGVVAGIVCAVPFGIWMLDGTSRSRTNRVAWSNRIVNECRRHGCLLLRYAHGATLVVFALVMIPIFVAWWSFTERRNMRSADYWYWD